MHCTYGNNWVEDQICPISVGRGTRGNWLFAGSPCADRHGGRSNELDPVDKSPKLNQLDPYAYLKDVLLVPATHKVSLVGELLPHRRQPGASAV